MDKNRKTWLYKFIERKEYDVIKDIKKRYVNGTITPYRELEEINKILMEEGVFI